MVKSERRIGEEVQTCTRYYISSLDKDLQSDATRILMASRSHWQIENKLHWVLDVSFNEDTNRVRKGNGQANLAVLRHIALNLLRKEKVIQSRYQEQAFAGWLGPRLFAKSIKWLTLRTPWFEALCKNTLIIFDFTLYDIHH